MTIDYKMPLFFSSDYLCLIMEWAEFQKGCIQKRRDQTQMEGIRPICPLLSIFAPSPTVIGVWKTPAIIGSK